MNWFSISSATTLSIVCGAATPSSSLEFCSVGRLLCLEGLSSPPEWAVSFDLSLPPSLEFPRALARLESKSSVSVSSASSFELPAYRLLFLAGAFWPGLALIMAMAALN